MAWADNFISANDFDSIRLSVASQDDILNWSYGLDLKILLKTVAVVLARSGAM